MILLDFRIFLLFESLISSWVTGVARTKPRSDLDRFCLSFLFFFAIGTLDLVWGDGRGEDKTSFVCGLIWLDFCYLMALALLGLGYFIAIVSLVLSS